MKTHPALLLTSALILLNGCQTTSQNSEPAATPSVATAVVAQKPIQAVVQPAPAAPVVSTKPKKLKTVTSLIVDFSQENKKQIVASVSDFQQADAAILSTTPINVIRKHNVKKYELDAIGAFGIQLTSLNAHGPFSTNKGKWNDRPILDGYIFTKQKKSDTNQPTLEIAELNDIPTGATITLSIWGVGDTPDSDTVFELHYNGATIDTLTTDHDGSVADTHVQFTFIKAEGANSLTLHWAMNGTTVAGFSGFSLVAKHLE